MFTEYQSALLRDDGGAALQYLSDRTVKYYDAMLSGARSMPEGELRELLFLDRFTILRLRSTFDTNQLATLTGKELLVYAVEQSWIDKVGTALFEVQEVRVKDDFAAIRMLRDDVEIPVAFEAYRESGKWKLDLTSVFEFANLGFVQQVESLGMTEDEFIDQILKALGHSKGLSDELWIAKQS